ncbi:MAG: sulfur carrier protein ThiS adenylyltransferase ThiF [Lactobacillales bacterium]|jgi:sulfur carrier protein ThiS adenylyltransferase|nr:sulfur carrier protein ThiS adenylyltransferase ThiF [Lactobacillales bacterium]
MKIILNGAEIETSARTLAELKDATKDQVSIINGFATPDHPLEEGAEVTIIERGVVPPKEMLENLMMSRHTPGVHAKISKSSVAIFGIGGLGSNIAIALARVGVGTIRLIDFDVVEPSNLNRQQYKITDIGKFKTDALAEEIGRINPYIVIEKHTVRADENNVPDLISGVDVVCEAFDNPMAKAMLTEIMVADYPSTPYVSASGLAGYDSNNLIQTTKIKDNFYLVGDRVNAAQPGRGLMAPRVLIAAGQEANQILRILLGETDV